MTCALKLARKRNFMLITTVMRSAFIRDVNMLWAEVVGIEHQSASTFGMIIVRGTWRVWACRNRVLFDKLLGERYVVVSESSVCEVFMRRTVCERRGNVIMFNDVHFLYKEWAFGMWSGNVKKNKVNEWYFSDVNSFWVYSPG
jgi:hypothetical protein